MPYAYTQYTIPYTLCPIPYTLQTASRSFAFFLQYGNLRDWSPEVYYNLARAFHQVPLKTLHPTPSS